MIQIKTCICAISLRRERAYHSHDICQKNVLQEMSTRNLIDLLLLLIFAIRFFSFKAHFKNGWKIDDFDLSVTYANIPRS